MADDKNQHGRTTNGHASGSGLNPDVDTNSPTMTTSSGRPVGDNQNSVSAGRRGPLLMQDYLLFEKMAHFNRERVPERVVHAKGAGALRYLLP